MQYKLIIETHRNITLSSTRANKSIMKRYFCLSNIFFPNESAKGIILSKAHLFVNLFILNFQKAKCQICMNQNKITIAINPNQNKKMPPQVDGMIALKKIENYSYALTDEIGLGFSSRVYRGKNDLNNEIVAIKVIDLRKEDDLSKQFVNEEINILETIKQRNSQNLLRLYDVFKTKNNLYIITEFCEGKDVAKLLRKKKIFGQIEAQSILKQLLNAYRQLYELQIVHRDLKLANVFIKKGTIKLADFGFAIRSDKCQQKFEYNVGSPYYMPPESLKFNRYSFKSDVWSFGVIAFEMVYGHLPWKEKVETVLFEKITNTPVEELFDPQIQLSDHYKQFITSCLQIDYEKRATPQFLINFEWPMAQDYVEGVESESGGGGYKPLSLIKIPQSNGPPPVKFGTANAIDDEVVRRENVFKVQHQISQPISHSRDKSPVSKHQFKQLPPFQQPPKYKTVFRDNQQVRQDLPSEPTFGNFLLNAENIPVQQIKNISELSILNQIHYCRFMAQLFDFIDESNCLPEGYLLKNQLANKILGKYQALNKLAQGENVFMIQGFNEYKNGQRWRKLKEVIERYDKKYKEKFNFEFRAESNDQILVNSIKYLRGIPSNFYLLQQLTYFYQLKDLQRRLNPSFFAINSKLQILCSRKSPNSRSQQPSPLYYQRLNQRLNLLGLS